jgi:hypothetical protein
VKLQRDIWVAVTVFQYLISKTQWERGACEAQMKHPAFTAPDHAHLREITRCLLKNPGGSFLQDPSGGSQFHGPGRPMEKQGAQIGLQLSDMSGKGWLRNP